MEQKKFEFNENNYEGSVKEGMSSCGCNFGCMQPQTMMCEPICECPQERICHRYMCYEVPQE